MNEGFANYSEYLWFEHKDGIGRADHHRINELNGYLGSLEGGSVHPLIWFDNPDSEAMFDAHSYNKGGLVLHMLRNYVGDEAFFAALNKYLVDNAYTAVEAHDLRLAFEEVTGQDLNWFFNQWYFSAGHPKLIINREYDDEAKTISVIIEQTQDPEISPAIFQLPINIDIYAAAGQVERQQVIMTERKQTFTFAADQQPKLVNVDPNKILLAEREDNKTEAAHLFQYYNAPGLLDRFEAIQTMEVSEMPEAKKVLKAALKDEFWFIRNRAIGMVKPDEEALEQMALLAQNDSHSKVREGALSYLIAAEAPQLATVIPTILEKEQVYSVVATALFALNDIDPVAAAKKAEALEKTTTNASILAAVGGIYALQGNAAKLPFFEENWNTIDGPSVMDFFGGYAYLLQSSGTDVAPSLTKLHGVGIDGAQSLWRRYAATKTLADLKQFFTQMTGQMEDATVKADLQKNIDAIIGYMKDIKEKETDQQLKSLYGNF